MIKNKEHETHSDRVSESQACCYARKQRVDSYITEWISRYGCVNHVDDSESEINGHGCIEYQKYKIDNI